MTYQEALNFDQKWTEQQAFNDLERYLLREEKPAMKAVAICMRAAQYRIPKKPTWRALEGFAEENASALSCPTCNNPVANYWVRGAKPAYCQFCGQAIDWGD